MQGSESTCASYSRVALPRCQGPASGIRSHHCPHPGPSASFSPRPHSSLGCPPAHTDLLAPGLASPSFSFVADGGPVPSEAICSHVAHGASGAPWRKSSMGRSERPRLGQHVRLSPVGPRAGHSQIRFLPQEGTRQVLLEIRALETWGRRPPPPPPPPAAAALPASCPW